MERPHPAERHGYYVNNISSFIFLLVSAFFVVLAHLDSTDWAYQTAPSGFHCCLANIQLAVSNVIGLTWVPSITVAINRFRFQNILYHHKLRFVGQEP